MSCRRCADARKYAGESYRCRACRWAAKLAEAREAKSRECVMCKSVFTPGTLRADGGPWACSDECAGFSRRVEHRDRAAASRG